MVMPPEVPLLYKIVLAIKKPNLRIIGIEEGEEWQIKGPENIFNKIIEESFSNLKKDIPIKGPHAPLRYLV